MENKYKLSSQLGGHKDEVRGICVCGDVGIATSSRDGTIILWKLNQPSNRDYVSSKVLRGHTSSSVPLAWISTSDGFPKGRIVSGCKNKQVAVWDLDTSRKCRTLKGHQQKVTGIALDGSDIIASSIDGTLRRWREDDLVDVWKAHNKGIQAVMKHPSGELITGTSDGKVKLSTGRTLLRTCSGHSDAVRSLAVMPGSRFLSASDDGSIRLWALDGKLESTMVGHTSIVYSVDGNVSGVSIVSGSKDCFAKIWRGGACFQSIEHPGCVWDAKFLENDDIVTACSDGVVRVWTLNSDRNADSQEAESYASLLKSKKRKPGLEALEEPGTSDGQTKVVSDGENDVAYAWNMTENKWDKRETSIEVTIPVPVTSPLPVAPPCDGRCETVGNEIVTVIALLLSFVMCAMNVAVTVTSNGYNNVAIILNLPFALGLVCCYLVKINREHNEDKKSKKKRAKCVVRYIGLIMVLGIFIIVIVLFSKRDVKYANSKKLIVTFKYSIAYTNLAFIAYSAISYVVLENKKSYK